MDLPSRYDRNMRALSPEESASLAEKRVTVVGAGGLGGFVVEMLARIGVGRIRVIDADVFEQTNLNRQLFATERTLGAAKVDAAVARIAEVNSEIDVEPVRELLTRDNARALVRGSDVVVDALDNMGARFWLAHACQEEGIPVVYGAIAGWFGQVATIFPGDVSFVTIYGSTEGEGVQKQEGNLSFTAACVASHQVAEAVKVLTGRGDVLRNRLLMIDMLFGSSEEMELRG